MNVKHPEYPTISTAFPGKPDKVVQGQSVPSLGFDTVTSQKEPALLTALTQSLDAGCRLVRISFDSPAQAAIGKLLQPIPREELFVVVEISTPESHAGDLEEAVQSALCSLGLDYVDLVLIQYPEPDIPLETLINCLEQLKTSGTIRYIGLNQFTGSQLQRALSCGVVLCNLIEYNPLLEQDHLLQLARSNDVLIGAIRPFAKGEALDHREIQRLADRKGTSPANLILKWLIDQENVIALSGLTLTPADEAPAVSDLELDKRTLKDMDRLGRGRRNQNGS